MAIHQDRNRTLVSHSLKPLDDTILSTRTSEISRNEAQSPLRASLLGTFKLVYHLFDVLRSGSSNDGIVLEPRTLELLFYVREDLEPLFVGEVDGLSRATQNHQPCDSGLCKVDRVGGLGCEVKGGSDWVVVGGFL